VFRRGNGQEIGTFPGQPFDSRFAGNTIELCPVGALTGAPTRFFGRTWEIGHTPSVCTGCSTGCNVRVDTRHGSEVVRLWSRENPATDDGWLCDPGRFGFGFVNEGRLEEPLVESGGQGVPATWQQAIARAGAVLERHAQSGTLGILASPRMTSEELFSVARLARTVLRVPHLDHTARYLHPSAVDLREFAAAAGLAPGTLRDIQEARQIITIGVDLSREQPVTDLRVKKAVTQRGADLVVVDAEELELSAFARHTLRWNPGDEAGAILSLANAVASPSEADGLRAVGELLRKDGRKVVLLGWRIGESPDGGRIRESLAALSQALGGEARCVTILRHCNSRGALDLGVYPAEDPVSGRGMSGEEMLRAACEGRIRALWILGEEPLQDADPDVVRKALNSLEALVFQGWSLPAWLERVPDAALPSTTFAEMDGTFTNTHGRVQRIFRAIRPKGKARPGWEIVNDLARALGHPFESRTVEAVFEEMCEATPVYRGLSWNALGVAGRETAAGSAAAASAARG
jgi:NADH-quinone oxidoreductase subunit G